MNASLRIKTKSKYGKLCTTDNCNNEKILSVLEKVYELLSHDITIVTLVNIGWVSKTVSLKDMTVCDQRYNMSLWHILYVHQYRRYAARVLELNKGIFMVTLIIMVVKRRRQNFMENIINPNRVNSVATVTFSIDTNE